MATEGGRSDKGKPPIWVKHTVRGIIQGSHNGSMLTNNKVRRMFDESGVEFGMGYIDDVSLAAKTIEDLERDVELMEGNRSDEEARHPVPRTKRPRNTRPIQGLPTQHVSQTRLRRAPETMPKRKTEPIRTKARVMANKTATNEDTRS